MKVQSRCNMFLWSHVSGQGGLSRPWAICSGLLHERQLDELNRELAGDAPPRMLMPWTDLREIRKIEEERHREQLADEQAMREISERQDRLPLRIEEEQGGIDERRREIDDDALSLGDGRRDPAPKKRAAMALFFCASCLSACPRATRVCARRFLFLADGRAHHVRRSRQARLFRQRIDLLDLAFPRRDVHAHRRVRSVDADHERDRAALFHVRLDIFDLRGLRNRVAVLDHALNMQLQRLRRQPRRFIQRLSGGDAARKIRKAHAKIRIPVLMKVGDILHDFSPSAPGLPQLDPGLFLNAFQSAYRYVPVRMRHRHPPFFRRMPELLVASDLINLIPAVCLAA
jgi:hypothetical protein